VKLVFLWLLLTQIDYEGRKRIGTASDAAEEVLVNAKKDVFVPKEDNSLYVPNLSPDTLYTFNISAKYLDGTYGAAFSIRLDTGNLAPHTASRAPVGLYSCMPSSFSGFFRVLTVKYTYVKGHLFSSFNRSGEKAISIN